MDPQEVTAKPEAWQCIGAEETRLIDYLPCKIACQKIVRKDARYLPLITAPLRTPQDRCIASPRLLAHTISSRFELHMPYYRIEHMYERLGVPIPRQTLCGWSGMASDACGLVIEHIKRDVFADGHAQIDETPVKYQDPPARKRVRHRLAVGHLQPRAQRVLVRVAHRAWSQLPGKRRAARMARSEPVRRSQRV